MKKLMIIIALTAFTLTACNKKQSSGTTMEALPIDVARPMVQNVTLTKDYPGYLEAESTVDLVGRSLCSGMPQRENTTARKYLQQLHMQDGW